MNDLFNKIHIWWIIGMTALMFDEKSDVFPTDGFIYLSGELIGLAGGFCLLIWIFKWIRYEWRKSK